MTIICTPHHGRVLSARTAVRQRRLMAEQAYCAALVESALMELFAAGSE